MAFLVVMDTPQSQPCWRHPNHAAHSLGLAVQFTMAQEPADKHGDHLFFDVEVDQTITCMTQAPIVKIAVKREERWSVQLMQQWDDFVVFHTFPPKILTNLP
jgi:hypothetical protein